MTSLNVNMKFYSFVWLICTTVFLTGYLFTTYSTYFLGLTIGFSASYLNLWTSYRNAKVIGHLPDKLGALSYFSYIIVGLSFVMRISLAIIAVWLALQFPKQIDLASVVIGLALL